MAVRWPLPVMMKARALPLVQPGRLTISCTKLARLGVRWSAPAAPIVVQAGGDQEAEALLRARVETLPVAVVKVAALSAACAFRVSVVASDCASSVANWM